jgi:hypothetical protein
MLRADPWGVPAESNPGASRRRFGALRNRRRIAIWAPPNPAIRAGNLAALKGAGL